MSLTGFVLLLLLVFFSSPEQWRRLETGTSNLPDKPTHFEGQVISHICQLTHSYVAVTGTTI